MKLYLVRHGETELNLKKVYYGSTDCGLTEKGKEQAVSLKTAFADIPLDLVLESPLRRAKDTATLLLDGKDVKREEDERLKELNFGDWEGKSYRDLQGDPLYEKWCDQWQTTSPPRGECFLDLAKRVGGFYEELLTRPEKSVLIVAHHAVLQQLTARLFQADPASCWHYAFIQGTFSVFDINGGFAVMKYHNVSVL